jgi:thiamine-phosphate pyrophosphorylase
VKLPRPPLLLITDSGLAVRPLPEIVASAFAGGCRWVSVREKQLPPEDRAALVREIVALARSFGATVTVHADLEAAALADGVHLPRTGSPAEARRRLGPGALIGYSAHDAREAERAAFQGADYVTLSPIFPTESKPGYGPALGLRQLRDIAGGLSIPVVALGGIVPDNAAACLDAGAAGLAVMGPAMRAHDPAAFVADLLARVRPKA